MVFDLSLSQRNHGFWCSIGKVAFATVLVLSISTLAAGEEEPERPASSRCYVDKHNRLIADGEPFFPLGFYGGRNLDDLR